jgi:hypothetical protein
VDPALKALARVLYISRAKSGFCTFPQLQTLSTVQVWMRPPGSCLCGWACMYSWRAHAARPAVGFSATPLKLPNPVNMKRTMALLSRSLS